jgi:AraC family transcriptional regulator
MWRTLPFEGSPGEGGEDFIPASVVAGLGELLKTVEVRADTDVRLLEAVLARASSMVVDMLQGKRAAPERGASRRQQTGLAPWQKKRVRALVEAKLPDGVSVAEMAAAIRLSASHFARTFPVSFGCTPHAYLLRRRIARAQGMMRETGEPLAQIALACGFSDQSQLSRQFHKLVGSTPSSWRRINNVRA